MKFGVGPPIRRVEDLRLLTGKGRCQDDQTLHRPTWCVFVRSHHAHARIRSIDTEAAACAPGVVAVFIGTDYANDGVAMSKAAMPRKKRDGSPMFAPQRPALVVDRARYVGPGNMGRSDDVRAQLTRLVRGWCGYFSPGAHYVTDPGDRGLSLK
jgi:aerobic carbon-monoxide dehydrogenase large subunit